MAQTEETPGRTPAEAVGRLPASLLRTEVVIVVMIAIGVSASKSVLRFVSALTAPEPLAQQTATLSSSQAPGRPWIDLGLQLIFVGSLLLPMLLALHLLRRTGDPLRSIGVRADRIPRDVLIGAGAAAAIGTVGLAGYLLARELGASVTLVPTSLPEVWWRIPVLVLLSVANAALEEVVLVGYLGRRLQQLGFKAPAIVMISAGLRGLYHLYQGASGFLGNLAMGAVFATYFHRTGRVVPLIVAHALIDIVAFVGYLIVSPHVTWL